MTSDEKLTRLKLLLRIDSTSDDDLLSEYLEMAATEILQWRYSNAAEVPDEVPSAYEMTQVMAVVYGYTQAGNEGQTSHSENGVSMTFSYADMLRYIRANVIAIAGVLRDEDES